MLPEITKTLYSIGILKETGGFLGLFPDFEFRLKESKQTFPETFRLRETQFQSNFFHFEDEHDLAYSLASLLNVIHYFVTTTQISVLEFLAKSAIPYEWMLSVLWQELVQTEVAYPTVITPYPHRFDFNVVRFANSERRRDREQRNSAVEHFRQAYREHVSGKKILILDDVIDTQGTVGRMTYVNYRCGARSVQAMAIYNLNSPWWGRGQKISKEIGLQNPLENHNPFICERLPETPESIAFQKAANGFAHYLASRIERPENS